jgi:hypothetical protein
MKKIIILSLLTLISSGLIAQTVEMVLPSDLKQQTIITEPATLNKGFLRVGLIADYVVVNKYFNSDGKKEYFPESVWASSWGYSLLIQYGISDRLTGELWVPYKNEIWNYYKVDITPEYNTFEENSWDLKARGLGDINISGRYQIIRATDSRPSLVGALDIGIPTGRKNPANVTGDYQFDLPTGIGVFTFNAELRARKIIYPFAYSAYAAFLYHLPGTKLFQPSDEEEKDFQYGSNFNTGASVGFHLNDWIAVTNELNYFYAGKGEKENAGEDELETNWAISYEARLVFQVRRFRLAEAVRLPLMGKTISADPLYVILLQYTF